MLLLLGIGNLQTGLRLASFSESELTLAHTHDFGPALFQLVGWLVTVVCQALLLLLLFVFGWCSMTNVAA